MTINLTAELLSIGVMLLPFLLSFILTTCSLFFGYFKQIRSQVFLVLFSSLSTILVIGTGLSGLTKNCFPTPPECSEGSSHFAVHGNFLSDATSCMLCVSPSSTQEQIAHALNQARPVVVVAATFASLIISSIVIIQFGILTRRSCK